MNSKKYERFKPDMYAKSIYTINYTKLKEKKIKILVYDFDNTIVEQKKYVVTEELKTLLNRLKKDFKVIVISNTIEKKKIDYFCKECDIEYVMNARKPFKFGYKKVKELSHTNSKQICMIGDQLLTDIWGAKRQGYYTVLVEPIHKQELFLTKFNRIIENKIFKKLKEYYNIERGKYYE